jgi:hypothetical protein
MFTSAQVSLSGLFCIEKQGCELTSPVRAITEWLVLTLPAGAPVILFTCLNINYEGRLLRNFWFHLFVL